MPGKRRYLKSLSFKVFVVFFFLPSIIIAIFGSLLFDNSQSKLEAELFDIKQLGLKQISQTVANSLSECDQLINEMANDSQLVELLSLTDIKDLKQVSRQARTRLSNNRVQLINAYVVGFNGVHAAAQSAERYPLESLNDEVWFQETIRMGGVVTEGPFYDETLPGIFRNYIRKSKIVTDHLTGIALGVVIFEISELKLTELYKQLDIPSSKLYMVDSHGTIVSCTDQDEIGRDYREIIGMADEGIGLDEHTVIYDKTLREEKAVLRIGIPHTTFSFIECTSLRNITGSIDNMRMYAVILLAVVLSLILLADFIITRWITGPIIKLENAMQEVARGNLDVSVSIGRQDELGRLGVVFNGMTANMRGLIRSIKEKEKLKRKAEVDFFQAQINPHFMYNTLSSVRFMISVVKTAEAEDMLIRFSKMLRYMTAKSDKFVTVHDEIEQIENYIEILKVRYLDSFSVKLDIDGDCENIRIPSFILQPVVENAVYHNQTDSGRWIHIRIRARLHGDVLLMRVTDDGVGISKEWLQIIMSSEEKLDDSVGLENIDNRIKLNFGLDSGISVKSKLHLGTRVDYVIRLKGGEEK